MLNHTRISAVPAAVIVLLFVQFLFIACVTGFREHERMVYNIFRRQIREKSKNVHYRYMTSGTNDVIHIERDVICKQQVSSPPPSPCPTDCNCYYPRISALMLNCTNRSGNATSLPYEINTYLPSVAWNFTALLITDTTLTAVPESICQLERLTSLGLYSNHFLTRLPDNCFTRLHELQAFYAAGGGLTSLQNGLFDNLTKLQHVYIIDNQISSIGAHLFDVTANLPNLEVIYLLYNKLTEIDVWPVKRAQLISGSNITLSYNHISRFTNSLGWHYDCNSAPLLSPKIDLRGNNIRHLNELFRGWNITGLLCCAHARRYGKFIRFDRIQIVYHY